MGKSRQLHGSGRVERDRDLPSRIGGVVAEAVVERLHGVSDRRGVEELTKTRSMDASEYSPSGCLGSNCGTVANGGIVVLVGRA